ncbi:hypothetical protein ABID23_000644 [Bartonella silvatica]|uniref:Uncharacterized protein n=1 Tax=Bartonella silvatica TaxID=357760 RepID=A0ABV2HG82_9HYPH
MKENTGHVVVLMMDKEPEMVARYQKMESSYGSVGICAEFSLRAARAAADDMCRGNMQSVVRYFVW